MYIVEYGRVEYGIIEYGRVEYGIIEYGIIECGKVEYGIIEYGIIEYGIILHNKLCVLCDDIVISEPSVCHCDRHGRTRESTSPIINVSDSLELGV
jgi:hypothetical protein